MVGAWADRSAGDVFCEGKGRTQKGSNGASTTTISATPQITGNEIVSSLHTLAGPAL
jgi:hypothetical protein